MARYFGDRDDGYDFVVWNFGIWIPSSDTLNMMDAVWALDMIDTNGARTGRPRWDPSCWYVAFVYFRVARRQNMLLELCNRFACLWVLVAVLDVVGCAFCIAAESHA